MSGDDPAAPTEPAMALEKLHPIFPRADFDVSEAFYARLGFETVFKSSEAGYLLLRRDAVEVHFFLKPDNDKWTSDHGAYLRPADVDALSAEIAALDLPSEGIPRFHPAEDKPWGIRELALLDPDGNLIRAGVDIQTT